jgi:Protein involved in chromosome segregation, interacts with SMC proteins
LATDKAPVSPSEDVIVRLSEIQAREQAATGGTWSVQDIRGCGLEVHWREPRPNELNAPVCHMRWTSGMSPATEVRVAADCAFIAHARQDIPWLLQLLTSERRERETERQKFDEAMKQLQAALARELSAIKDAQEAEDKLAALQQERDELNADLGIVRIGRAKAQQERDEARQLNAIYARALGEDSEELRNEVTRRREAFLNVLTRSEAAESSLTVLRGALDNTLIWLRGWPVTMCRSEHGADVPIVLMNPANLEAKADELTAALSGSSPVPPCASCEALRGALTAEIAQQESYARGDTPCAEIWKDRPGPAGHRHTAVILRLILQAAALSGSSPNPNVTGVVGWSRRSSVEGMKETPK